MRGDTSRYELEVWINYCLDCSGMITWREWIPIFDINQPPPKRTKNKQRFVRCAGCAAILWAKRIRNGSTRRLH